MRYLTFAGVIVLFLIFVFSIVHYANLDSGQESLGGFWNSLTGLNIFNENNSSSENIAIIISLFVLSISTIYILLKVVNEMIFVSRR